MPETAAAAGIVKIQAVDLNAASLDGFGVIQRAERQHRADLSCRRTDHRGELNHERVRFLDLI
ncbi:MAG: hypothetical protein MJ014_02830, partial [Methanocorpusculum sp.]|nr:hypothetical protein [Methanocorpusculum sp.]